MNADKRLLKTLPLHLRISSLSAVKFFLGDRYGPGESGFIRAALLRVAPEYLRFGGPIRFRRSPLLQSDLDCKA